MAVQRDKVIASAEKLVAKGKIEPAIKEYERLLDENPNDVNTLNRIGDLWVRINRNDEAVKVFGKIADHYSKDGFFLKAIAIYKKINKLDPSKLDTYAKLADLYAKQGLAMEAKSQYQVLADYYLKHGEAGNALSIYRKISELDPNSINVHVKLADLYSQNNQPAEALKEYDRVGRMLLKRGMLDEAVQVFRKALKNDPRNTDLVDSLVTALLEAKDFENARQIVETALNANSDNPRLLAMLGRIQLGKGDTHAAGTTLERALAADPNDAATRDALAELYVRQNNADRALEMVVPLVEKAMGRGERHAAIEQLNRILRLDPGHTPTLERLVAAYQRLNEETNVLSALNSLAEAHIAKGRFEAASKVLEKLIQQEPQNAQHRTKLQFVRSQMGGVDTMPTRPKPAPPVELPPMEIEEPAPSFDFSEDAGSGIRIDQETSAAAEPEFSLDDVLASARSAQAKPEPAGPAVESPAPAPPAPAPPAPAPRPSPAVAAEAELPEEAGEDLDFITEHLTEAEVFAKYGLAEKAAEHLRAVLERAPKNLTAHERLLRILLEEGVAGEAGRCAAAYVAALEEKGELRTAENVRADLLSRGISLEAAPAAPREPEGLGSISFEEPSGAPDLSFGLGTPAEIEFDLEGELAASEPPVEPAEEVEELAPDQLVEEEEITLGAEEIEFELPAIEQAELEEVAPEGISFDEFQPSEAPAIAPEPVEETFELPLEPSTDAGGEAAVTPSDEFELPEFEPAAGLPVDELSAADTIPEFEDLVAPEPLPEEEPLELTPEEILPDQVETPLAGEEPPAFDESAPDLAQTAETEPFSGFESLEPGVEFEELPLEEVGEVDFYIEQELFEEAQRKLETLMARFPGNPDLESRRERVAARLVPARPHALSRDEIENELLSAIPDDDEEISPAPPPPVDVAVPPASPAFAHEESLFADEDNFFDLAAELESELAEEEEPIALAEEEQSLEEIFREFKKGVEQQLDSEDYDTHYNLGIAYKEMGLIDEAIGEFQLASKDPKRAVECASMLGLCFLEKGMPQLAIKWYRKGVEIPEITEEEHMGLLYDLGTAYQEVGDTESAQKAFLEVYGMNTNYRDVVARMKALDDARK